MNPHAAQPTSLVALAKSLWRNRQLILQMTQREVLGRYKGSFMGLAWSFFTPLLMLAVYTFIFSVVFKARWGDGGEQSNTGFAVVMFVGMIVHGLFAEALNRAPGMILSNVNYVKKVVFPLEILPVIAMCASLFHTAISLGVLLAAYALFKGFIHWTAIFIPFVLFPLVLLSLGLAWMLASLGVFLRDVGQTIGLLTTVMMFLAPVFYPLTAVPAAFRPLILLNPLTFIIEQARAVLVWGFLPNWTGLGTYTLIAIGIAWQATPGFRRRGKGSRMSSNIAIRAENLSKCYQIYGQSQDRLKQIFLPRMQRLLGQEQKNYYHDFWAMRDVSFEVRKGETVGIIGRNGSGKSTLLQLICGILTPTSGIVQTHGRIAALLELGSGFNPEFTGRENVFLNAAILGLPQAEIESRYDAIAAFADIGEFIDQPVKTYSSGMYVRLAFAIQANIDPDILVVDEALAVGDAYFVHRCMDRLHALQASGTTVLLVTHDGMFVKRFCDRAVWVDQGKVVMSGNSDAVVDEYLGWLFRTPTLPNLEGPTPEISVAPPRAQQASDDAERHIPNVDRRLGDQRCSIVGVGLYDLDRNATSVVSSDSELLLRYTVENRTLTSSDRLIFGYIFRNFRGEEIAATNTLLEECPRLSFIADKDCLTVEVSIRLPLLHPGNYSFSVGVSYQEADSTEIKAADRLINAVVFAVTTTKQFATMICFDSRFTVSRTT